MDYDFEFGSGPQDVTVTLAGTAGVDPFRRMIHALGSDPRFRPGMAILFDDTALDPSRLSSDDLRAIAQAFVGLGDGPAAIVAPDTLTFGLARMFEVYAEASDLRFRIFTSRDDATAWLAGG